MAFFEEVLAVTGLDRLRLTAGYQVINYNGEAVYIEGVRRVRSIAQDEITVGVGKSASLIVTGSDLVLYDLSDGSVTVKGSIISVAVTND